VSERGRACGGSALSGTSCIAPGRGALWSSERTEPAALPTAKHDDQVDALGLIGQLLTIPGTRPKKQETEYDETLDPYQPAGLDEYAQSSVKLL